MVEAEGNRLRVQAPMTIANAKALMEAGCAVLPEGQVVADLSAVQEVDSSSLTVLFAWARAQRARGGELRVERAPESIRTLADMYGVNDLIAIA